MKLFNNDIDESLRGDEYNNEDNNNNNNNNILSYRDKNNNIVNYKTIEIILMIIFIFMIPAFGIIILIYSLILKKNFFKVFAKAFIFMIVLTLISLGLCTYVILNS